MTSTVLDDVEWLRDEITLGLAPEGSVRVPDLGVFELRDTELTYKPSMALKATIWPVLDDLGLDDGDDGDDDHDDEDDALLDEIAAILRTGHAVEIPGVGELVPVVQGHLRTVAFRPSPELARALGI